MVAVVEAVLGQLQRGEDDAERCGHDEEPGSRLARAAARRADGERHEEAAGEQDRRVRRAEHDVRVPARGGERVGRLDAGDQRTRRTARRRTSPRSPTKIHMPSVAALRCCGASSNCSATRSAGASRAIAASLIADLDRASPGALAGVDDGARERRRPVGVRRRVDDRNDVEVVLRRRRRGRATRVRSLRADSGRRARPGTATSRDRRAAADSRARGSARPPTTARSASGTPARTRDSAAACPRCRAGTAERT